MKTCREKIKLNGENISVTYLYSIKQNKKLLKYYRSKRNRIKLMKPSKQHIILIDTYICIQIYMHIHLHV